MTYAAFQRLRHNAAWLYAAVVFAALVAFAPALSDTARAQGAKIPVAELPAGVPAVQFVGPEPLEIVTSRGVITLDVELALNNEQRARGLMYRPVIPPGYGMLFEFTPEREVHFWMQNTYASLDMLFITANGRIRSVAENATPLSTALIPSGGPVRFVLEIAAGNARRLGIAPGDRIAHRLVGPR